MTDQTPTSPPLDLAALKETANAATPGPWDHHSFGNSGSDEPATIIVHAGAFDWPAINEGDFIVSTPRWDADEGMNARHIAAFDPPTALALLARVTAAESSLARCIVERTRFGDAMAADAVPAVVDAIMRELTTDADKRAREATARAEAAEAKIAAVWEIVDNDGIEVDTREYGSMLAVNADDISGALEDPALEDVALDGQECPDCGHPHSTTKCAGAMCDCCDAIAALDGGA